MVTKPPPPPVITLAVPVLGWYSVQSGGLQTSQFLSIPNASYLSSPDGMNDGLVGVADGALAHLAGIAATMDGGQNLIMWDADALDVPDGVTIWNPYPSLGTPGRWIAQIQPRANVSLIVATGAIIQLSPATELVSVRKQTPSPTTILLPTMVNANLGQTVEIADVNGVSAAFPITVTNTDGALIGPITLASNVDVINANGATHSYTPDGVGWVRG
jgi:hypothetical protein